LRVELSLYHRELAMPSRCTPLIGGPMKTRRGGLSLHVQEILGSAHGVAPGEEAVIDTRRHDGVDRLEVASIVVGCEQRGADDGGKRGDGGLASVVAEGESAKGE
jgi:hypothetical protein